MSGQRRRDVLDHGRQGLTLGFLIHDVSRMRRNVYDQIVRPLGFTRARWWVLAHLARDDGMTQSHLAELLQVGRASLGDQLDSLEREGLVRREAAPDDRRAKHVFLTAAGHAVVRTLILEESRFNLEVLKPLSAWECGELIRLLSAMKASLRHMERTGEAGPWKQPPGENP
jgi:DNA-binding MarR family transcriptional regulator